jgi:50S ribosomal subunit-associated GTPase HflX
MIEVFKTNLEDPKDADWLIQLISTSFPGYQVNFDLEDCDRIMRVKCEHLVVDVKHLILILKDRGFEAEVLHDDFVSDLPG